MSESDNIMMHILETVSRTGYELEFREKFLADPRAALQAEGITPPSAMEIVLIMDDPTKLHILVPVFDDQPMEVRADHPLLQD